MRKRANWPPDPDFIMERESPEAVVRNEAKCEVSPFDRGRYRETKSAVTEFTQTFMRSRKVTDG